MRILFFSDFHFHNWNYGAGIRDGYNTRLLSQVEVFKEIDASAIENNVDVMVFAGDMFHTHSRVDAAVLQQVSNAFRCRRWDGGNTHIMVGNHDMATKSGLIHSLEPFKFEFNVVDQPYVNRWAAMFPYTESQEQLEAWLKDVPDERVVVLHQGVGGVPVNSGFVLPNETLTPELVSRFRHTFTGHYHDHKHVNDKLTIIGAPQQHNWGDKGQKRGWLIYNDQTGEIKHFESNAPKFVEIEGMSTEGVSGNFVRIKNPQGNPEIIRDFLRESGALSVEFELPDTDKLDHFGLEYHNFQLEDVVKKYSTLNKLSKHEIEVGKQIRAGTYEAP